MRAGALTTPVTVKRPTASRDSYGHDALTFSTQYDPLMVRVNTAPVTAVEESDGVSRRQVVTFTAAFASDLDVQPRDRIEWEGEDYEVEWSTNRLGLREWIDIQAVRLAR